MTELWTTYGNDNNLTEIWFDGGALPTHHPAAPPNHIRHSRSVFGWMWRLLNVLAVGVTGIEGDLRATVTALLKQHQPKAVAFNGCVVKGGAAQNKSTCITPNALRWIGAQPITQLSC